MKLIVSGKDEEIRLDKFLSSQLNETRNQIDQLIKKGCVSILNKKNIKSGLKLQMGQTIIVTFPEVVPKDALEVDFDIEVVYEDDAILVINKPSGVIVHGAASVKEATLVDWLKLNNISLSTISGEERHGIVHRLDKGTSGLMVVAKTNKAHVALSRQLEDKTMGRLYLAIIDLPLKDNLTVNKAIGRNPNNRLKQGIVSNGKSAKTKFIKLVTSINGKFELIAAKLFTGRTHQIRVHLESLNRHILGDVLYGFQGNSDTLNRVNLHAYNLYFVHPITKKNVSFCIKLPDDMQNFCENNFKKAIVDEKINTEYILSSFNNFH
jgi:23S rRNA pseudouridine1911/1915/1917 synthase